MADELITCPKCGQQIPLTAVITKQIEDRIKQKYESQAQLLQKEFEDKLAKNKAVIEATAKKQAEAALAIEIESLKTQVVERTKQVEEAKKKELSLLKRQRELDEREKDLQLQVHRTLDIERAKIRDEATTRAKESIGVELKGLKAQLEERSRQVKESQEKELTLLKFKQELEDKEKAIPLQIARTLDKERKKLLDDALGKMQEEHRLKDAEKDKKMADMLQQIEELKKKGEQGSQQLQGEVQELELEEILGLSFKLDEIEPIAKGVKGADVLQKVRSGPGGFAGSILWESKRTKNWSDGWVEKLKDNQRSQKADIAVIVTETLPKGIDRIGFIDGVWITDLSSVVVLAHALRMNLIEVAKARSALTGKSGKMELVYQYLCGPEFRHRVEAIVEAFRGMEEDLASEKRAMERTWAKREKQIQRIIKNTVGMYGDVQGIIDVALPPIQTLELPAAVEIEDEEAEAAAAEEQEIDWLARAKKTKEYIEQQDKKKPRG